MALDPLATTADLSDRNITPPDGFNADALLDSASDAVRDAAGCPITVCTSTVALVADDYCTLDLPGGPVSSVASVTVAGDTVTGWTLLGNVLYMPPRWTDSLPVAVTITYTHGYTVIPSDIVDLVCAMTAMAFGQDGAYGASGQLQAVRLGEYSETYTHVRGSESPSPVAIPDTVRERLRARFGTSAVVLRTR